MNNDKYEDEIFLKIYYEKMNKNLNILKNGINTYYKDIIVLQKELCKKNKIIEEKNNIIKNNKNIIIEKEKEIDKLNYKINNTLNNLRSIRKNIHN